MERVIVRCALDMIDQAIAKMEELGFSFEYRDSKQVGHFVGFIQKDKIETLRTTPGILEVTEVTESGFLE